MPSNFQMSGSKRILVMKFSWWWNAGCLAVSLMSLEPVSAAVMNKTLRVDHGRAVVVVSQRSVLWLEFAKEPIADALVPHKEPDIRHCRAHYRFQLFDGASGTITNGHGTVEEVYQRVPGSNGTQVKD